MYVVLKSNISTKSVSATIMSEFMIESAQQGDHICIHKK